MLKIVTYFKLFILLLTLVQVMTTTDINRQTCVDHYPASETLVLFEKLIDKYGRNELVKNYHHHHHKTKQSDGEEINIMLVDDTTLMLNGYIFYVHAPSTSSSTTHRNCIFDFDYRQYYRRPIAVETSSALVLSRSLHNNKHHLIDYEQNRTADGKNRRYFRRLDQLHFKCPPTTYCCGLFCCPQIGIDVQSALIDAADAPTDASEYRYLSTDSADLVLNNRRYSAIGGGDCVYSIGEHDLIHSRVRFEYSESIAAIYYQCSSMHQSCCHLDCIGDDDDEQQMPDSFAIVEHSHHAGSYTDWPLIGALLLTIVVCSILIYLLNWVIKRRQMTMGRELNQQRQTSSTDVDDDDDEVDNRRTRNAVDRIIRRESNRIIMV